MWWCSASGLPRGINPNPKHHTIPESCHGVEVGHLGISTVWSVGKCILSKPLASRNVPRWRVSDSQNHQTQAKPVIQATTRRVNGMPCYSALHSIASSDGKKSVPLFFLLHHSNTMDHPFSLSSSFVIYLLITLLHCLFWLCLQTPELQAQLHASNNSYDASLSTNLHETAKHKLNISF